MAKLSKPEARAHTAACALLEQSELTHSQKWDIFETWREDANHVNSIAGAFFTPIGLARDFSIEVTGHRVIDLCAGIGALAFAVANHSNYCEPPEITCIEINPDYIEVGRKLVPEATWIQGDVTDFELIASLGHFDCAIANPPFGRVAGSAKSPRYTGPDFEYKVLDVASNLADWGVFLLPQGSTPYTYSGSRYYEERANAKFERFRDQTGIDTAHYDEDWHGVRPCVEVVNADFIAARATRHAAVVQADLFAVAAELEGCPPKQRPLLF